MKLGNVQNLVLFSEADRGLAVGQRYPAAEAPKPDRMPGFIPLSIGCGCL